MPMRFAKRRSVPLIVCQRFASTTTAAVTGRFVAAGRRVQGHERRHPGSRSTMPGPNAVGKPARTSTAPVPLWPPDVNSPCGPLRARTTADQYCHAGRAGKTASVVPVIHRPGVSTGPVVVAGGAVDPVQVASGRRRQAALDALRRELADDWIVEGRRVATACDPGAQQQTGHQNNPLRPIKASSELADRGGLVISPHRPPAPRLSTVTASEGCSVERAVRCSGKAQSPDVKVRGRRGKPSRRA